jgi:hypothetical protein
LLVGVIINLAALIVFLFLAVRQRTFKYPMSEEALITYASQLTNYYSAGSAPATTNEPTASADEPTSESPPEKEDTAVTVEKAVVDDLRSIITAQLAEAAQISRANNIKRLSARAKAFATLMTALAFALALIVVILVHDAPNGGPNGQGTQSSSAAQDQHPTRSHHGADPRKAEASGHADSREGGVGVQGVDPSRHGALQHDAEEGHPPVTTTSSQTGAANPSGNPSSGSAGPAQPSAKPSAPPMQVLQKSMDGGAQQKR